MRAIAPRSTARPAWTSNPSRFTGRFTKRIMLWRCASPVDSVLWMDAPRSSPLRRKSGKPSSRMFERFWGNAHVTAALEQMIARDRLAQTLLFAGPEGVGKATMARRLAARLLGHEEQSERD